MNPTSNSFYTFEEKGFKHEWSFHYWAPSQQTLESTLKEKFTFDTTISSESKIMWEVGVEEHPIWPTSSVLLYWKSDSYFNRFCIDADMSIELLSLNSEIKKQAYTKANVGSNRKWCIFNGGSLGAGIDLSSDLLSATMNHRGKITFVISVSIRLKPQKLLTLTNPQFQDYTQTLEHKVLQNWENLRHDLASMDIVILTRDMRRIEAHKLVLRTQCPHLASLYPAQFSKMGNAIVAVDFSLKVMEILVHYFYSGKLLESWSDDDVVTEFCTAVALYQLNEFLEILDQTLGNVKSNYNLADAWKLVRLARKLSLTNAEQKLSNIIMYIAKSAQSPDELMSFMFGKDQTETSSQLDTKY